MNVRFEGKTDNIPKQENLYMTDHSFGDLKEQDRIFTEKEAETLIHGTLNTCTTKNYICRFYYATFPMVNYQ
jgi:hypothetical protein